MKFVYICSPLQGDIERNIRKANGYCRFAAQQCVVPLAPHTIFTQFLDENIAEEREAGLYLGLQLLKKCDELWVFGSKVSNGMFKEIELAKQLGIPIYWYDEQCQPMEVA